MKYGLRLTGTGGDLAALHTLSVAAPTLPESPWRTLTLDDGATVLASASLTDALAKELHARGVSLVALASLAVTASREARGLLDALPTTPSHRDPAPDAVILRVAVAHPGAHRTVERLLSLGRDDVRVCELVDGAGERVMLLRVARPPVYLLMRAHDEPSEGVTAYVRAGDDALWVALGRAHPMASAAARALQSQRRMALVDRDGAWTVLDPAALAWRSVYDAVSARFEAPRTQWQSAPGETRFTLRLRLAPATPADPELWLLDSAQFLALDALLDALTPAERERFTVARLTGPDGTRYALHEKVRAGMARLGVRVSEAVSAAGFTRAAGTDNLYLPVGRQLLPRMRRDELRALLGLDAAHLVAVLDTPEGPSVVCVRNADEAPLTRWIDYVATDRRAELDRLVEQSVFAWPELSIDRTARPRARAESAPAEAPKRTTRSEAREAAPAPEAPAAISDEPAATPEAVTVDANEQRLRDEARALEEKLRAPGSDDTGAWAALATVKASLGELDDAAGCIEAAVFYTPDAHAERLGALVELRAKLMGATRSDDELTALAERPRLTPSEAAYFGARVLEGILRGATSGDGRFLSRAERVLTDPETPVSRRLAWSVARALHGRAGDALGLTRARERILGGLNEKGLHDAYDMPHFARYALALDAGDGAVDRARTEQLASLEQLWTAAQERHVREAEPLGAYLRLVFAVGFTRLGAIARGRDVSAPVEAEEQGHEPPNRLLFKLYRARAAHVATQGDAAAWKANAEALVAGIRDARVKDRVEFLRTRSEWLRTREPAEFLPNLKPAIERALADFEASPEEAPARLAALLDDREVYAFEMRAAVERAARLALRLGRDELTRAVLRETMPRLRRVNTPGVRAAVLGECIPAAATLQDPETLDRLVDEVIALVRTPGTPLRDLLLAVTPGLQALRRFGAAATAKRLLDAIEPLSRPRDRESVKLRAALLSGLWQLDEGERATALLDRCVDDVLDGALDPPGRYDAGAAVLTATRHWPATARTAHAMRFVEGLARFTDTFTASAQKLYETHKVLIAERVIDAVADTVTFEGGRVRAWLDDEEQALRRRVLADWRQACGR